MIKEGVFNFYCMFLVYEIVFLYEVWIIYNEDFECCLFEFVVNKNVLVMFFYLIFLGRLKSCL